MTPDIQVLLNRDVEKSSSMSNVDFTVLTKLHKACMHVCYNVIFWHFIAIIAYNALCGPVLVIFSMK